MLYPLKFVPIQKERIWGGHKLHTYLNKPFHENPIGESWELSVIPGDESIVANGELTGKTLSELVEIYKSDLVGKKVFATFGCQFPLLFKFIDANQKLSIQVHPDDDTAMERHACFGKTEFWYILDAEEGAELVVGFNQSVDEQTYLHHLQKGTLETILRKEPVKKGDAFFIPAGLVHAIGEGVLLAEIQQSSDVTYRLFDYNRKDVNGNERQLHTEQAIDVIDFNHEIKSRIEYTATENGIVELISCQYFTVNLISTDRIFERDLSNIDSFVVYIAINGSFDIECQDGLITISEGKTVLLPAYISNVVLEPNVDSILLEVFIN